MDPIGVLYTFVADIFSYKMVVNPFTVERNKIIKQKTKPKGVGHLVGGFNPREKYARQNGFIFPK